MIEKTTPTGQRSPLTPAKVSIASLSFDSAFEHR